MSLTDLQKRFVNAYLQHFNATRAAKDAGYDAANDNTFASIGWENLRKPAIYSAISRRLEEEAMSASEVLRCLSAIARAGDEKTSDRLKALELMGKAHKLFTERIEHSGDIDVVIGWNGDD